MKKLVTTVFLFSLVLISYTSLSAQTLPAPDSLTATVSVHYNHGEIALAWKYTGASSVSAKFNVYRKTGAASDTGAFRKIATGVRSKSFMDGNVQFNQPYTYQVTAVTAAGESGASNAVTALLTPPPPPAKAVVSGKVTDETTGAPIARAYVNVFSTGRGGWNTAYTDSFGNWKVKVDTGEYALYTSGRGYKAEYYDNVTSYTTATKFHLAANDSVNYNVALAAYVAPATFTVSGSVKDAQGNIIASAVKLFSVKANSHYRGGRLVMTDSLGNFSLSAREGDTVVVYAAPKARFDWYPQYYNNKQNINEADRIAVTANVTGINFVLAHKPVYPNSVSGKIKDTAGVGVAGNVHAFPRRFGRNEVRRYAVATDSLGNYSISNLLPGQYIMFAHPEAGYKPSYFKYDGSSTLNWREADSVVVDSAAAVTGIDIVVKANPDSGFTAITGIVKDVTNAPVNGAFVYAVNTANTIYSVAVSDARGRYTLVGLVPGDYVIVSDKQGYRESSPAYTSVSYASAASSYNFTLTTDGVTDVENGAEVISGYALNQNYPNPFNPSTTISYQLPVDGMVTLKVYNVLGKEVATLFSGFANAGTYTAAFDASALPSGVYLYKLEAGKFSAVKKLMLMK